MYIIKLNSEEASEGQPNDNKQKLVIQSLMKQVNQAYHLHFGRDSKAEERESFKVGKREGVRCALIKAVGMGRL